MDFSTASSVRKSFCSFLFFEQKVNKNVFRIELAKLRSDAAINNSAPRMKVSKQSLLLGE